VATLRRTRPLDDLDDKSLTKVLLHERKQLAVGNQGPGWDQQAIAALGVLRHSPDGLVVESMSLATHAEEGMLRSLFAAVADSDCAATWDASGGQMAMLRFRALLHRVSLPTAWAAEAPSQGYIDLAGALAPAASVPPRLGETANKLGFPGLLGSDALDVTAAWLNDQAGEIQALCELQLLNVYLVALRLFTIRGLVTRYDNDRFEGFIRDWLQDRQAQHFRRFLQAWDGD
jgi:hypothetical protein